MIQSLGKVFLLVGTIDVRFTAIAFHIMVRLQRSHRKMLQVLGTLRPVWTLIGCQTLCFALIVVVQEHCFPLFLL